MLLSYKVDEETTIELEITRAPCVRGGTKLQSVTLYKKRNGIVIVARELLWERVLEFCKLEDFVIFLLTQNVELTMKDQIKIRSELK